jgi:serine/threonine protein kinase
MTVFLYRDMLTGLYFQPSNILLTANGLYLTDFGTATDFSMFSQSVTTGNDRGTPKYFSPEVAAYEESGRASDIFSLGCILLEMVAVSNDYSLQTLKNLRQRKDTSFHANLSSILEWFNVVRVSVADKFLLCEVRMMLQDRPQSRPTIQHVSERLQLLDHFLPPAQSFHNICCSPNLTTGLDLQIREKSVLRLTVGNTHHYLDENDRHNHEWTFFVYPSKPDLIEKIYCFLVSSDSLFRSALFARPCRSHH